MWPLSLLFRSSNNCMNRMIWAFRLSTRAFYLDSQSLEDLFSAFDSFETKQSFPKRSQFDRASSSGSLHGSVPPHLEAIATPPVPTRRSRKSQKNSPENGSLRNRMIHRGSLSLFGVRLPSKKQPTSPSLTRDSEKFSWSNDRHQNQTQGETMPSPLVSVSPASTPLDNNATGILVDFSDAVDPNTSPASFC